MRRRIYIVQKKVPAASVKEALEKEKGMEVDSVYRDDDEQRDVGFRDRS